MNVFARVITMLMRLANGCYLVVNTRYFRMRIRPLTRRQCRRHHQRSHQKDGHKAAKPEEKANRAHTA